MAILAGQKGGVKVIRWAQSLIEFLGLCGSSYACVRPGNSFEERLQFSSQAFVGTVVGYRLDDTSLVNDLPDCPHGGEVSDGATKDCIAFWNKVVAVQYDVETPIIGIDGHRKYEIVTRNDDGCAPKPGERWLTSGWYRDGFSMKLENAATPEQIDLWRSIAKYEDNN